MLTISQQASFEEILRHMEFLSCKIGPRMVGSEGDRRARDYCREHFTNLKLHVQSEKWDVASFVEIETKLKMLRPQTLEIRCRAFGRSISTPAEGSMGQVQYIAELDDFSTKDVNGKIVLIDAPHFTTIGAMSSGIFMSVASERGAKVLVMASGTPGNIIYSSFGGRLGTRIPAVNISKEDGNLIKDRLNEGSVELWCSVQTKLEKGSSENIIATLDGKTRPKEFICVTSHIDSAYTSPGANDNASGVAVVLEVARLLSKKRFERSVAFVIFSGEEGAGGSDEYVKKHQSELPAIKALLNFDMCARGPKITTDIESFYFTGDDPLKPGKFVKPPEWLVKSIRTTAEDLGYRVESSRFYGTGDEGVFLYHGIPSVFWGKSGGIDGISWNEAFPHYHNEGDTLERCDINSVKSIVDIATVVIQKLANADIMPKI